MLRLGFLAAVLAVFLVPGLAQAASCRAPSDAPAVAAAMLQAVNVERSRAGLAPLAQSRALVKAAQAHACDMARTGNFSHSGSGGSTHASRAKAAGCRWKGALAENIAWGFNTQEKTMASWMGSPEHRSNMLNRKVKLAGLAYATGGPKGPYWVMMFAGGC